MSIRGCANSFLGAVKVQISELQLALSISVTVYIPFPPIILPWQGEAITGVCSQIEEQVNIIDSLAADPGTEEEEHIRLALVELDVERARWLLRSYLRCRLDKIEQDPVFMNQDPLSRANLSDSERGYAIT